jgi:hypothetical protein
MSNLRIKPKVCLSGLTFVNFSNRMIGASSGGRGRGPGNLCKQRTGHDGSIMKGRSFFETGATGVKPCTQ